MTYENKIYSKFCKDHSGTKFQKVLDYYNIHNYSYDKEDRMNNISLLNWYYCAVCVLIQIFCFLKI